MTATKKYIIGYCRKSTDTEDKQVRSLGDQKRLIREFYQSLEDDNRYSLKMLEESRSAYHPGRPVFSDIVEMADRGEVHAIIILDPTRLSRNPEDAGKVVQRLADGKIKEILTVSGKHYSRSDTSQLFMLMLESTMSWKDSADKGDRVKIGMSAKAKEGGTTGPAPLGYLNCGEIKGERWMEFDPERAPKVQRIFQLAATGAYSLEALTVEAKKIGLRTRPGPKRPGHLPLQKTSIHDMLRNPTYKGMKPYQDKVYEGAHEGIVSVETWEKVQMELTRRCTHTGRPKDLSLRELFVMAGCVRCGVCLQRTMSSYNVKKGRYIIYECKNPNTKCRNCINQDHLLAQLYEQISLLKFDEDDHNFMRKTLKKIHERETKSHSERRSALENEYKAIEKQIADVFMRMGEAEQYGVQETISMKLAQLKMRKDALKEAMDKIHSESDAWIDHVIRCFELVKLVKRAIEIGSPETRQAVLKSLCSNYHVKDKKLVCDWLSPFKEKVEVEGCTNWLPLLDGLRTEWLQEIIDLGRQLKLSDIAPLVSIEG